MDDAGEPGDLVEFDRYAAPSVTLNYGDPIRPDIRFSKSEAAYYPKNSKGSPQVTLTHGEVMLAGWPKLELDRANFVFHGPDIEVSSLRLRTENDDVGSIALAGMPSGVPIPTLAEIDALTLDTAHESQPISRTYFQRTQWFSKKYGFNLIDVWPAWGGWTLPTPASDGKNVYVQFGQGQLGAYDVATGKKVWGRSTGPLRSINISNLRFTAPMLVRDRLTRGWSAWVDDEMVPVWYGNGLFRAVRVPAGWREVRFAFRPPRLGLGALITILALAFTAALQGREISTQRRRGAEKKK